MYLDDYGLEVHLNFKYVILFEIYRCIHQITYFF